MQNVNKLPNYQDISTLLEPLKPMVTPAQIHGLLCGVVCQGMGKLDEEASVAIAIGVSGQEMTMTPEQSALLRSLLEYSYQQLSGMEFDFQLLLPDDAASLAARSEELGRWCEGFLLGLESSGTEHIDELNDRLSVEGYDTVLRLTDIANIDYDGLTYCEQDETSFMEVSEYVRMAVLMLYSELHQGQGTSPSSRTIH